MINRNKKLLLSILLIIVIAIVFWLGSRYPALNEKALMGGDVGFSALGFDVLFSITHSLPIWKKIIFNFFNWIYTNRQGMLFGLMLASPIMMVVSLLRNKSFENVFANSFIGMVIGAPLGVCVNCAAPLAEGVQRAGGRIETALAMMISSPTLNIVVITMLLALFPTYMVVIKIALTLVFVLLVIPLLVTFFLKKEQQSNLDDALIEKQNEAIETLTIDKEDENISTWGKSIRWLAITFVKNFWKIIKLTVPLMLLAGLLGNILITLIPWEVLSFLNPETKNLTMIGLLIGIAIFGTFLPVPITFDVVITAVLISGGMPVKYAMILLFTLGIFSIYPWFLIKKSVSTKFASLLAIAVIIFGLVSGISAHYYAQWKWQSQLPIVLASLNSEQAKGPRTLKIEVDENYTDENTLFSFLDSSVLNKNELSVDGEIRIYQILFDNRKNTGEKMFSKINGNVLGIEQPNELSVLNTVAPFGRPASIAAGDIHNDGWQDVLVTHQKQLLLYANKKGIEFVRQKVNLEGVDPNARFCSGAMVDLNNDGWLDILFTIYDGDNYIIFNQQGSFQNAIPQKLPNIDNAVTTMTTTFGDLNGDGLLEIFLGNWSRGSNGPYRNGSPSSTNAMLKPSAEGYKLEIMPGAFGETLAALFADFNNDNKLDLIVGNDFDPPDIFYVGGNTEQLHMVTSGENLIEQSARTTMAISVADLNNDLIPEIFIGQISENREEGSILTKFPDESLCDEITDSKYRIICSEYLKYRNLVEFSGKNMDLSNCPSGWEEDCIAKMIFEKSLIEQRRHGNFNYCDYYPEQWSELRDFCEVYERNPQILTKEQKQLNIPSQSKTNTLLMLNNEGQFKDLANQWGLEYTGWSWTSRFADLDNDGWQDLYVATGYFLIDRFHDKLFFKNDRGKKFINQTKESGLSSFIPTHAYVYIDFDNDGDLDIITPPEMGPVLIYKNNTTTGNSIAFELDDHIGNRSGIGSKVIIHYGENNHLHQVRELQMGGDSRAFSAPTAWFGLGEFDRVLSVEILWSTGEKTILNQEFKSGAKYIIERGVTPMGDSDGDKLQYFNR